VEMLGGDGLGASQIKETNKMRKNKRKIHSAHKSGEKKKKSRN